MHLEVILTEQAVFSLKTFGLTRRTVGILNHIRKEIGEVEADPTDVMEWIDIAILAMDGAWRAIAFNDSEASPPDTARLEEIAKELSLCYHAKLLKNIARTWPDWRLASPDQAIEHDRSGE